MKFFEKLNIRIINKKWSDWIRKRLIGIHFFEEERVFIKEINEDYRVHMIDRFNEETQKETILLDNGFEKNILFFCLDIGYHLMNQYFKARSNETNKEKSINLTKGVRNKLKKLSEATLNLIEEDSIDKNKKSIEEIINIHNNLGLTRYSKALAIIRSNFI